MKIPLRAICLWSQSATLHIWRGAKLPRKAVLQTEVSGKLRRPSPRMLPLSLRLNLALNSAERRQPHTSPQGMIGDLLPSSPLLLILLECVQSPAEIFA